MKHLTVKNTEEETAKKLQYFSGVSLDKRYLLRSIVNSAPENLTHKAQLNTYFAIDENEPDSMRAGWLGGARAYAGLAVVALVLLGSGLMWFNFTKPSAVNSPSQFSSSQTVANGKVSNAVNAITEQTSNEADTALSSQVDNAAVSEANSQLQQMQESINAKF